MEKTVFLNAAKLDFDSKLDFSSLAKLTDLQLYSESREDEIIARVQGATVIITKEMPLTGEIIEQFPPSVKLICEAGTGYNNIDIAAARRKNIAVCNVPSYSTEAVAQLVITFMLSLSASLQQQSLMLLRGDYRNFTDRLQVPHFELQGKTLGIVGGTGAIGQAVMRIALALGMKVLIYSRTPKKYEEEGVNSAGLEELLAASDFVSLHCPLTPATRHLINRERLRMMKPTAFIINTARGSIIQEADLIEALKAGEIAGAGLDVQDPEPPAQDNPLFGMENVIMTPHIGWRRLETRQRLVELMAGNMEAFLQGKAVNIVN